MNKLRQLRKENNYSQEDIAKAVNISVKTVSRWENGETTIKKDKAQALADHFGVSVGQLLGYEAYQEIEDEAMNSYKEIVRLLHANADIKEIISKYEESQKKHGKWNISLFIDNTDNISLIEKSIKAQILDNFSREQSGKFDEEVYGTLEENIDNTYIALAYLPMVFKDFFGSFLTLSNSDKNNIIAIVESLYNKDKGLGLQEEYKNENT
ncbi:TPA: helix-turn-helix domain-containing protein [Streptococcus suis]|nr:helix-turn-helix domain-containing protein [Streptococcus suis]HEM4056327.1 helix-turn-helix domain-containing protein [Streptococcus suis]